MTDEEVRALADEVLCDTLGPLGFEKAQVVSGLDHDGEPALFIAAIFKPGSGPSRAGRGSTPSALSATRYLHAARVASLICFTTTPMTSGPTINRRQSRRPADENTASTT